jgi:hypothetical protein
VDSLKTLQSLGLELPTPAYLAGMLLFSLLGMAAWGYGRKQGLPRCKWLGAALMFYPYAVSSTLWLYLVGGALCAAVWASRA